MLVGSVTERESEWSHDDVIALLALKEMQRVGPHGHPIADAISELGNPANHEREWDWVVDLPVTDFAQLALNKAKADYQSIYPDADTSYLKWSVEKRLR